MKILVTGASGFLGSYITNILGKDASVLDTIGRSSSNTIEADLGKPLDSLIDSYDLVVHAAGKAHIVPKTKEEEQDFYKVNLEGTRNLLNSFRNTPKFFVFISSIAVYGLDTAEEVTEDWPLNAVEPYGKSKVMAEHLIEQWCKERNVKCTILRIPLLVGHHPPGNLRSMINGIKKGFYFNIAGGHTKKSMVFAQDVVNFIPKIMHTGGIYNLTDGYHPSFKELSNEISTFYNLRKPLSMPYFIVWIMAIVGEFCNEVFRFRIPINKRALLKITSPLTLNDNKASQYGWSPSKILENREKWLSN